jgi:hypothetical protein
MLALDGAIFGHLRVSAGRWNNDGGLGQRERLVQCGMQKQD